MKKIIYFIFILTGIFINSSYSQDKVFLMSEDAYVTISEYTDWNADKAQDYTGKYEYVYPGFDSKGEYAGDIYQERILVTYNGNNLAIYKNLIVEADWEQNDTLKNASISSNQLSATDTKGRFVTLKYTDKDGNVKYSLGLVLESPETKELNFYQKMKD